MASSVQVRGRVKTCLSQHAATVSALSSQHSQHHVVGLKDVSHCRSGLVLVALVLIYRLAIVCHFSSEW